jgi:hypothetical protein
LINLNDFGIKLKEIDVLESNNRHFNHGNQALIRNFGDEKNEKNKKTNKESRGRAMKGEWIKQDGTPVWMPKKEEETLIGKVKEISISKFGGNEYIIIQDNNEEVRTPSHKWLQNSLAKAIVGSIVKITFKGYELPKVKGNNPTAKYEVYIKE